MERILVVDDDPLVRVLLTKVVTRKGYISIEACDGEEALKILEEDGVALMITDVRMPRMDGIQLLKETMRRYPDVGVIVLTAHGDVETAVEAMKWGAYDFITKPLNVHLLMMSIDRALEKRRLQLELKEYQRNLERMVRQRTEELYKALRELKEAHLETVRALSEAIEAKDPYTRGHCHRVTFLSMDMAKRLGLSGQKLEALQYGSLLHDIGKIGIRGAILNKPGPLTPEEYEHVKQHPVIGAHMLDGVKALRPSLPIVLYHHERFDGKGYPEGLKAKKIPLEARIAAVADAYDAMTSHRPYRRAFPAERALEEIENGRGSQFDPDIADLFLNSGIYEEVGTLNTMGLKEGLVNESKGQRLKPKGEDSTL